MWNAIWKQLEERGITIKSGTIEDATFIESDPGKHGRKKPPVPVDRSVTEINTGERSGDTGNHENEKKLTREQKRQAKIRASENRIKRREDRKYSRTRRSRDST